MASSSLKKSKTSTSILPSVSGSKSLMGESRSSMQSLPERHGKQAQESLTLGLENIHYRLQRTILMFLRIISIMLLLERRSIQIFRERLPSQTSILTMCSALTSLNILMILRQHSKRSAELENAESSQSLVPSRNFSSLTKKRTTSGGSF